MPEATVHKDGFAAAGENQVRLPRQIAAVEPVAIAQREGELAYQTLGRGVLALHRAHDLRALLRVEGIALRPHVRLGADGARASGERRWSASQRTTGTDTASPNRCSA